MTTINKPAAETMHKLFSRYHIGFNCLIMSGKTGNAIKGRQVSLDGVRHNTRHLGFFLVHGRWPTGRVTFGKYGHGVYMKGNLIEGGKLVSSRTGERVNWDRPRKVKGRAVSLGRAGTEVAPKVPNGEASIKVWDEILDEEGLGELTIGEHESTEVMIAKERDGYTALMPLDDGEATDVVDLMADPQPTPIGDMVDEAREYDLKRLLDDVKNAKAVTKQAAACVNQLEADAKAFLKRSKAPSTPNHNWVYRR